VAETVFDARDCHYGIGRQNVNEDDAWYISCIAVKKKFHGRGLGQLLLKTVLEDLEKRGVKKVQACGQLSGEASDFSSGYWSMYERLGFREIGGEKNFKVGEKELNEQ